jgi:Concanavalin A-like lectin/glucanases superfamily/Trypsin-like peptidase domain
MSKPILLIPRHFILFTPIGSFKWIDGKTYQSNLPENFRYLEDLEPEAQEKIVTLVRDSLQNRQKLLISNVRDLREDRPADFLQVGLNRSLAVCRVARYFPCKDFQIFIEDIKQLVKKSESFKNFDSIPKLKEIFLIPNETADEIFTTEVKSNLTELKSKLPEKYDAKKYDKYSFECSGILLDALQNLTENQLAQLNPIPVGSGFLVGATHLLTNYHVLFDEEVASQCVAQFHYEESLGADQKTIDYELDPDTLFIREPSLDYTLVQLKFNQFTRQAGHHFGWLQLVEDDANIIPGLRDEEDVKKLESEGFELSEEEKEGDNVILIHHPKGRQKKIDLTNNRVIKGGLYKSFLRYTAESDYGSSGCPVFNTKWELVALNHAAILQSDGKTFVKQGVRICQIVADLKQKSASFPKLKSFIEDFVVTAEQLIYPPLPAALEFDGERSYVDCGNDKSLNIDGAITIEAWVKNNDQNSDGVIVYRGGSFEVPGYCIWRYANKIRVELQNNSKRKIIVDTDNVVLDDQSWHHVVFTWDKKDIKIWEEFRDTYKKIAGITIYIDGEPQPISSIYKKEDCNDFDGIGTASENLTIGRAGSIEKIIDNFVNSIKNDPGSRSIIHNYFERPRANLRLEIARQYYFNGAIAEVRLWKVARTQDQIKNNRFRRLNKQHLGQDWSNLVGYWRLEEAVGNRAYNLKFENSIKGENQESAKNEQDQAEQKWGLRLYGLSDYIDCGKLNYLMDEKTEISAITIEAWVRNYGGESDGMIVHQGGGWDEDGYSIWMYKEKIRVELQNHPKKIVVDTVNKFPSEQNKLEWHHVAFTWEKVSRSETDKVSKIEIYIDGERQDSKYSLDGNCNSENKFSDSIGIPKVNLNIGRSQNHGRYFNGSITEVRIWNVARTQDQIKNNMDKLLDSKDPDWSNLIGYWRLDEEEGDKAANLVSKAKYGLVHGGRWEKAYSLLEKNKGAYAVVSQAKIMRASQYPTLPLPFGLTFNESDDRVECSNEQEKSLNDITVGITVEAWIKHKFGNCSIVKRSDNHENDYSLSWYEGKIRVKLQASQEKIVVYTEENFPDDHLWHHVAFTLDQNSHEISIYIDGRVQNCVVEGKCKTIISTMQAKSIGLFTGPLKLIEKPLIIGCKEQGTDYYNIELAEVRLWNLARTQDQIQKNMSRRLSPQDSDRLSEQDQYWSKSLVGYWRLDDGTEDNQRVFDQTPNENHGTIFRTNKPNKVLALPPQQAQPSESPDHPES